jgi:hypothetical protein
MCVRVNKARQQRDGTKIDQFGAVRLRTDGDDSRAVDRYYTVFNRRAIDWKDDASL